MKSSLYRLCSLLAFFLAFALLAPARSKRKVIIDQDAAGPGGTDMQSILALINSPETDGLGITVVPRQGPRSSVQRIKSPRETLARRSRTV